MSCANVSHRISLSPYVIDAIVISKVLPKNSEINGGKSRQCWLSTSVSALVPAPSYWETP
jgi:hypothetical protein